MNPLIDINKTRENDKDWAAALIDLAKFLRSPQGCPWDRKQTTASFAKFLTEEAQELLEAISENDNPHIEEEFGDTLFCALMFAIVAEDEGKFTLASALQRAHQKMIRRHAHVFAEQKAQTPEDALLAWEQVKAQERATQQNPKS